MQITSLSAVAAFACDERVSRFIAPSATAPAGGNRVLDADSKANGQSGKVDFKVNASCNASMAAALSGLGMNFSWNVMGRSWLLKKRKSRCVGSAVTIKCASRVMLMREMAARGSSKFLMGPTQEDPDDLIEKGDTRR